MVAFNFKRQFVPRIIAGSKIQTIRGHRKRNAMPGDALQLKHGSRYRPVPIGTAVCRDAGPICIELNTNAVIIDLVAREGAEAQQLLIHEPALLAMFAGHDGFDTWGDLKQFWAVTHPGVVTFRGWLTIWGDSFEAAAE